MDARYGMHSSRHTHGTYLYRVRAADLEVVQGQLGHASIRATTIYAKVTKEDKARAADALAKTYRDSQRNRESGASWPQRQPPSGRPPAQRVASS